MAGRGLSRATATDGDFDGPAADDGLGEVETGRHDDLAVVPADGGRPASAPSGSDRPAGEGVRISDDVVGAIAGIAAGEVDGVAGMNAGLAGSLTEMLGKRNPARGVRVEVGTREAAIDLFLTVEYGVRIPVVAQRVQENVRRAIETMTGLRVVEVNIHIQGLAGGPPDGGSSAPGA